MFINTVFYWRLWRYKDIWFAPITVPWVQGCNIILEAVAISQVACSFLQAAAGALHRDRCLWGPRWGWNWEILRYLESSICVYYGEGQETHFSSKCAKYAIDSRSCVPLWFPRCVFALLYVLMLFLHLLAQQLACSLQHLPRTWCLTSRDSKRGSGL